MSGSLFVRLLAAMSALLVSTQKEVWGILPGVWMFRVTTLQDAITELYRCGVGIKKKVKFGRRK